MKFRRIVSLTLLLCGTMLIGTSFVLYIGPQWHIAYWTGWTVLGMSKAQWSSLHMNLGFVMLATALLHLYLNWENITRYVKSRAKQLLAPSRELVVALVVTFVVIAGTHYDLPPLQWTTELHKGFQAKVAASYGEPPIGFTEFTPLEVLARRLDLDLQQALQQLAAAGYPAAGPQTTIMQLAIASQVSPQAVYNAMVDIEGEAPAPN